ncbi:protein of unknown function [Candidatus Promineifilum breve]|uniref:Uncharacterized protein n=1 Tax=Candidatus Promineifilum breve TaxID=1806508 RepID=A0A160T173_9CHLR|nr:protein of unknown function [Candidatus Promineifilum breve]
MPIFVPPYTNPNMQPKLSDRLTFPFVIEGFAISVLLLLHNALAHCWFENWG